MTPKEKRDRLFKKNKPIIRPFELYEGGKYSKDIGRLWVAHKHKHFRDFPLTEDGFIESIEDLSGNASLFVVDDENVEYDNAGPVGFLWIYSDGWAYEPHVEFFPWATNRNKLRSCVSFFQWIRYLKTVGACIVQADKDSSPLFSKCKEYGVLHYVGKIINGFPDGDRFIYSVRGRKNGNK